MKLMEKELRVSVCKIAQAGLIKDGKMGASKERAERIKKICAWLNIRTN